MCEVRTLAVTARTTTATTSGPHARDARRCRRYTALAVSKTGTSARVRIARVRDFLDSVLQAVVPREISAHARWMAVSIVIRRRGQREMGSEREREIE